jgi:predicted GNAT family N-acyltransferase
MKFSVRVADWSRDAPALKSVRHDVFVVEQRVPAELEWDDATDAGCCQVLAEDAQGHAIGCGRLLPDGHIGRMAVLADWRGRGIGAALLVRLIELARERGDAKVMLNAQIHALPFYTRFDFVPVGDLFDEAGIAHQAMERRLGST